MSVSFQAAINAYNNAAKVNNSTDAIKDTISTGLPARVPFADVINNSVSNAVHSLQSAEQTTAKALVKQADITDVVTAVTNAEVTLKTVITVRDKLVAAHQEILRMPI